jgi:hypothetical protein
MPTKTAVAGDDWGPKRILALVGLVGAGVTVYKFAKGQKVAPLELVGAVVGLATFFL